MDSIFYEVMQIMDRGYTVSFNIERQYFPRRVLKIELTKGNNHQVELIDFSIRRNKSVESSNEMISRALHKAEWEFENAFGKE